jgi:CBS domain-containing protein
MATSATTLAQLALQTVPVVSPQTSLAEVMELLEGSPLRMVVLVGDGMYFGTFNDRTVNSSLVPSGADPALLQVGPYVHPTKPLKPTTTVAEALASLAHRKLSALPVVSGNLYQGVITKSTLEKS